ncbi:hypothetical protein GOV08_00425 [Candidatus Woesearchaeota archaeon]|nr:hypothetical protein [Candidatus Woesearchaeota archaeon]
MIHKIHKDTPKEEVLQHGKGCRMCGHCCSMGSGYTQEQELKQIAEQLNLTKKELKEKHFEKIKVFNKELYKPKINKVGDLPFGPCVFLKDKKCAINLVKPLHCRIGICSEHGQAISEWYTSNFLVDKDDPESIRQWAARVDVKPSIQGAHPKDMVGEEKLKEILGYKDYDLGGKQNE